MTLRCFTAFVLFLVFAPISAMGATSHQVLPDTVVPAHYDLRIVPDAVAMTFAGDETIDVQVKTAISTITLNAQDLTFGSVALDGKAASSITLDKALGRAVFTFAAPIAPGAHKLKIAYTGKIATTTFGFFAMDYDSPAGKKRTLATNLEPAGARMFLPSWDEPSRKATFSITVDAPADQMAIGNMPVAVATPLGKGLTRTRFVQTPKMSTYLLFLSVGDYERIHKTVAGVDVGVVVKRGDTAKAAYALQEAVALLPWYNNYFGRAFPLPKLDLIAAPGKIQGGSMENWGANFYSQEHLLFDPQASTEADRQLVFLVVGHEVAHQWFGDLVTMAWWDNLWLNEGFARWMQTYVADALHPEWRTGLQAQAVFQSGMQADARPSTHPVLQEINSAEQAAQAFDNITYDKGAAVINMLVAHAGDAAFRTGIRAYMAKHAYGNTVDSDLWSEIQAASGKPILKIEQDFTQQAGLPLIRVSKTAGGVHLAVDRFVVDPENPVPVPTWRMPVKIMTASGERTLDLTGGTEVADPGPLVNAGAQAYARVLYEGSTFESVSNRFAALPAADQINLINDASALGRSGYAPASRMLDLISRLPPGADPIVWGRAVSVLQSIDAAYGPSPDRTGYQAYALKLLMPLSERIGLAPAAGEDAAVTILRGELGGDLAQFGDAETIARARATVASEQGGPAVRRAAELVVAQTADAATFDALLAKARATPDLLRRGKMLEDLAQVEDPALTARIVEIALGPDTPAGSAVYLLLYAAQTNPDAAWSALAPHLDDANLPVNAGEAMWAIPMIAGFSADPGRIAQLQAYADKHIPADARQNVEGAKASILLNARVRERAVPDWTAWIAGAKAP